MSLSSSSSAVGQRPEVPFLKELKGLQTSSGSNSKSPRRMDGRAVAPRSQTTPRLKEESARIDQAATTNEFQRSASSGNVSKSPRLLDEKAVSPRSGIVARARQAESERREEVVAEYNLSPRRSPTSSDSGTPRKLIFAASDSDSTTPPSTERKQRESDDSVCPEDEIAEPLSPSAKCGESPRPKGRRASLVHTLGINLILTRTPSPAKTDTPVMGRRPAALSDPFDICNSYLADLAFDNNMTPKLLIGEDLQTLWTSQIKEDLGKRLRGTPMPDKCPKAVRKNLMRLRYIQQVFNEGVEWKAGAQKAVRGQGIEQLWRGFFDFDLLTINDTTIEVPKYDCAYDTTVPQELDEHVAAVAKALLESPRVELDNIPLASTKVINPLFLLANAEKERQAEAAAPTKKMEAARRIQLFYLKVLQGLADQNPDYSTETVENDLRMLLAHDVKTSLGKKNPTVRYTYKFITLFGAKVWACCQTFFHEVFPRINNGDKAVYSPPASNAGASSSSSTSTPLRYSRGVSQQDILFKTTWNRKGIIHGEGIEKAAVATATTIGGNVKVSQIRKFRTDIKARGMETEDRPVATYTLAWEAPLPGEGEKYSGSLKLSDFSWAMRQLTPEEVAAGEDPIIPTVAERSAFKAALLGLETVVFK